MNRLEVGRLRSRVGANVEAAAFGRRLSNFFGHADIRPPAMPPAVVLVVRRMTGPMPRKLLTRHAVPPLDTDWERSVRGRLDAFYRHAVRPDHGYIPTDAEAVVFRDESEMLACLALDLSRGEQLQRWWWRVPLRRLPSGPGSLLAVLLREQARQLPAILAQLTAWRQAAAVIAALSPSDSSAVLGALLYEYDLNTALLPPAVAAASPGAGRESVSPAPKQPLNRETRPAVRPPPWRAWLPAELARALSREQEYLLGVGLALYHAPASASSSLFAAQVAGWWRDAQVLTDTKVPKAGGQDQPRPRSIESDETSTSSAPASAHTLIRQQGLTDQVVPTVTPVSTSDPQQTTETSQAKQADSEVVASAMEASQAKRSDLSLSAGGITEGALNEGVQTRLGGVLYLINLLVALDLPDSFEASWGLSSKLGGWGLLDILARALLDDALAIYAGDPIWRALAGLDGRESGLLPGHDFQGGDAFRIPEPWFRAAESSNGAFYWAASGQRLRLWSASGYLLVDAARGKRSAQDQARLELERYTEGATVARGHFTAAPLALPTEALRRKLNPRVLRWLAAALPYIRYRLHQALPPEAVDQCEFLKVPGWLYVSAVHVDLVAALDAISLPVRIAGLDRDPGWVAKLGRVVLFHFQ